LPKHVGAIVKEKLKECAIQCILLVNLYVVDNARYNNKKLLKFIFWKPCGDLSICLLLNNPIRILKNSDKKPQLEESGEGIVY
jgi:hypothetical protein